MGFSINNPGASGGGATAAPRFDLVYPGSVSAAANPTANVVRVVGLFTLPYLCSFTNIVFVVDNGDANGAHFYDVGVYDLSGNLQANIGAQNLTTAGVKDLAIAQTSVTLNPGQYAICVTGNATTVGFRMRITTGDTLIMGLNPSSATASTSGALPSSITYSGLTTWAIGNGILAGNFSLHS